MMEFSKVTIFLTTLLTLLYRVWQEWQGINKGQNKALKSKDNTADLGQPHKEVGPNESVLKWLRMDSETLTVTNLTLWKGQLIQKRSVPQAVRHLLQVHGLRNTRRKTVDRH